MNPKISVIVPVYNTGTVLRDTLNSILSQTFRDFELILVDDGSTDGSGAVCDEYALTDRRVVVLHQINSGICKARNSGISIAKGEYITFCDHDDVYLPRKLEISYDLAQKYHADIVNVGHENLFDDGHRFTKGINLTCHNRQEISENIYAISFDHVSTIWDNLYRYKAFKDNFYFDSKYTRGQEDINFNFRLLQYARSFVATKEILYKHIIRKSLSTSSKIHIEVIEGMIDAIINYLRCLSSFEIDFSKRNDKNIMVLAKLFRILCVYMVKAGYDYCSYKDVLVNLRSIFSSNKVNLRNNIILCKNKDLLFFDLLQLNERISYVLCKLFYKIHG